MACATRIVLTRQKTCAQPPGDVQYLYTPCLRRYGNLLVLCTKHKKMNKLTTGQCMGLHKKIITRVATTCTSFYYVYNGYYTTSTVRCRNTPDAYTFPYITTPYSMSTNKNMTALNFRKVRTRNAYRLTQCVYSVYDMCIIF